MILWRSNLRQIWPLVSLIFKKWRSTFFLVIFYDSLTYDKNGLCPSWFFNVWLSTFLRLDSLTVQPTTKLAFSLSVFKKMTEYIFWLYSMIVWPTTKMASALPDFLMFDWVHSKTWFFDGPTYNKFVLWSLRFSIIDWIHVLARLWPTTKIAPVLPDFPIFDWVN